jgi:hypothetical protein
MAQQLIKKNPVIEEVSMIEGGLKDEGVRR